MLQSIRSTMAVVTLVTTCTAHGEPLAAEDLRRAVETNLGAAVALYREFLSLPNDAVHRDDIEDLVTWLEHEFNSRDFETRRIRTAGSPALFARRSREGAGKTVLVYLQADGQPVDPRAWDQANPYAPVLKERTAGGSWREIPWASIDEGYDPDCVCLRVPRRTPRGP